MRYADILPGRITDKCCLSEWGRSSLFDFECMGRSSLSECIYDIDILFECMGEMLFEYIGEMLFECIGEMLFECMEEMLLSAWGDHRCLSAFMIYIV